MSMKLRQVQPGTLRRVMTYLGKREPSRPSIDHTQPMETIGGAESEDTTDWSALLPRIDLQMVKTARCPRCEMMAVVNPID